MITVADIRSRWEELRDNTMLTTGEQRLIEAFVDDLRKLETELDYESD